MTVSYWDIKIPYDINTDVGTTIDDVQQVNLTQGRAKLTDSFRAGSISISGRNPATVSHVQIGDTIAAELVQNSNVDLYFRVTDVRINYGIVANEDEWVITGEDSFAVLGRNEIDISWAAGSRATDNAEAVCIASGLVMGIGDDEITPCNAQTIVGGNALQIFNTLANTEQAFCDSKYESIRWYGRGWQRSAFVSLFTDVVTPNTFTYDFLEFNSLADNFSDQVRVTIQPNAGTATSGTGIYSYDLNSYNQNVGEAENLAQFVKSQLDQQFIAPNRIGFKLSNLTRSGWPGLFTDPLLFKVTFRGDVYEVYRFGWKITSTLAETRITFNVVPKAYFSIFILDSAESGVLDTNKLGY